LQQVTQEGDLIAGQGRAGADGFGWNGSSGCICCRCLGCIRSGFVRQLKSEV